MSLEKTTSLFGVEELQIAKLLTDVSGSAPTYDAYLNVQGVKSIGMDKNVETKESRGDEMLLDTEDVFKSISVTWENAKLPLEVCALIENSTLTTSGTGDTEKHELIETTNASGNYFKLFALCKRGNVGTHVGVELYKVKGTLTYSFKGEDFATCSFKGTAIPIKGTVSGVVNPIRKLTVSASAISIA